MLRLAGISAVFLAAGATRGGRPTACALPPEQFFVNYYDTPSQIMISWASSSPEATVEFGTSTALGLTTSGNATRYTFHLNYTSPYIHHVLLTGLQLGTPYFYRVGGPACGFSATFNVTTHPGVGTNVTPLRFAIIGDLGQTNNSNATLAHMEASPGGFAAVILWGDLSYADSDEPRWDSWGRLVQGAASSTPWLTVPGNHEIEPDVDLTVMKPYDTRFRMPRANGTQSHYYSIDIGPVHFVMVSGFGDLYNKGSPQYDWLLADLKAVDRSETPWLVVGFHQPYYNSNNAHHNNGLPLQATIETPLFEAGVDLVFSGHVHAYERSHRVYQEKLNDRAPYYITIGDGGNREGLATDWLSPQPAWSAFRQASYGHGELTAVNATHMLWEWHQNPELEPVVSDTLWIVKEQNATAGAAPLSVTRPRAVPRR